MNPRNETLPQPQRDELAKRTGDQAAHDLAVSHRNNHPIADGLKQSVQGTDEPMARRHPMLPWDLVWYTFPVLLIVTLILMLIFFEFTTPPEQP